jgi:hypothetical protein
MVFTSDNPILFADKITFTLDKTILSPRESLSGQNLGFRTGVESNKNAIPEFQTSGMAIFKGRAVFPTSEKLPAMCKGCFPTPTFPVYQGWHARPRR